MLQQTIKAVTTDVTSFAEKLIAELDTSKQNDERFHNIQSELEKKGDEVTNLRKEVTTLQNEINAIQVRAKRAREAFDHV